MDLDMAFHLIAKSVVTENIPGYDISVEESRPCVCVCVAYIMQQSYWMGPLLCGRHKATEPNTCINEID